MLIFIAYMFFEKEVYIFGVSYLFLIQIAFGNTPFLAQENDDLKELYYSLPSKESKMVLGRFVYLMIWCFIFSFIAIILVKYLYSINEIDQRKIIIMLLCQIIVYIILFIQYPISYKLGLHNRNFLMSMICTLPGIIICSLPTFFIENKSFIILNLDNHIDFIVKNEMILISLSIFALIIIGYVSYLISCKICKLKEV